uniref:Uncharacterized protein n=1 Tax=Populus davidiana TaxID=266767 RepID=A0A6M2F099_9ROSI
MRVINFVFDSFIVFDLLEIKHELKLTFIFFPEWYQIVISLYGSYCFKDLDLALCVLIDLALCDFDNLAMNVKRIKGRESIPVVVNVVDVIGSDKVSGSKNA